MPGARYLPTLAGNNIVVNSKVFNRGFLGNCVTIGLFQRRQLLMPKGAWKGAIEIQPEL